MVTGQGFTCVEHHISNVLGLLISRVRLHTAQQFLYERMARVDLQGLLLAEVVAAGHTGDGY